MSRIVCNSGPLIALGILGRLDILKSLFDEGLVPEAVQKEIAQGGIKLSGLEDFRRADWIRIVPLKISKTRQEGYWIHDSIVETALREAGEFEPAGIRPGALSPYSPQPPARLLHNPSRFFQRLPRCFGFRSGKNMHNPHRPIAQLGVRRVKSPVIKFPDTFPRRTMASVVSVFKMIFVAVPAFKRVEPVKISGPTSGAITKSGLDPASNSTPGLKQSKTVRAPPRFAAAIAPHTNRVRPLAVIPTTTSPRLAPTMHDRRRPCLRIVFRAFHRLPQRRPPSRDDPLHPLRRDAETSVDIPTRPAPPAVRLSPRQCKKAARRREMRTQPTRWPAQF